jgi:hypothetical protein
VRYFWKRLYRRILVTPLFPTSPRQSNRNRDAWIHLSATKERHNINPMHAYDDKKQGSENDAATMPNATTMHEVELVISK